MNLYIYEMQDKHYLVSAKNFLTAFSMLRYEYKDIEFVPENLKVIAYNVSKLAYVSTPTYVNDYFTFNTIDSEDYQYV